MVSYKMSTLIQLMNIWNTLNELYNEWTNKTKKVYKHIFDFYYGYNDIWVFMNDYLTPVSLNNIHNNIEYEWMYNTHTNELKLSSISTDINSYKISWLSSKIRTYIPNDNKELIYKDYDIDSFIENLQIKTNSNNPPSMYLLFMCWCIYTKQWFRLSNNIEFHIITNMGDDEVIDISKNNDCLQIKNKEIHSVIPKKEDTNIHKIESESGMT